MNLKERAKKLKHEIPAVYLAMRDHDTPAAAKVLAGLTICCALSPIDLIPDFIPVLGYLDDLILLPLMIFVAVKIIPGEIWERCMKQAESIWEDGKPTRWYFAIPILAVWGAVLWKALSCFL